MTRPRSLTRAARLSALTDRIVEAVRLGPVNGCYGRWLRLTVDPHQAHEAIWQDALAEAIARRSIRLVGRGMAARYYPVLTRAAVS